MSGYRKQIVLTSTLFAVIVIVVGLGVYFVQPQSVGGSSIPSSSMFHFTATYNGPIAYQAPLANQQQMIGTCGVYSKLIVPQTGASDYSNDTSPIGVPVEALYFAIFNGTSSCRTPNTLDVLITSGGSYSSSVTLGLVLTSDNTSVYVAALTYTSYYSEGSINLTPSLPAGVHDLAGITFHFNMGPSGSSTETLQYANDTTFTINAPAQEFNSTSYTTQTTITGNGTGSYVGSGPP